jgi:methyl-accepting chemotaxis protein
LAVASKKSILFDKNMYKLNSVKKKMIAGFALITFINVIAFLGFELYNANLRLTGESLDKSSTYAEHIEKIISPIGVQQPEKLQNKITQLRESQYRTTSYIGVLDKNLKYIANTDKSKIGTEFKTQETEGVFNTGKAVSSKITVSGVEEYLSIVPFYNVEIVASADSVSSATAKINVPALVVVSMDTHQIMNQQRNEIIKIVGISLVLFIFSIIIAAVIAMTITNPLKIIRNHLHKMSEGDLAGKVSISSKDELLYLAEDINSTNGVLKDMIKGIKSTTIFLDKYSGELNSSTDSLSAVSEEIAQSMNNVAGNINMQSGRLSDTVQALDTFSNNLDNINIKTQGIEDNSLLIKEAADAGSNKINILISDMQQVQTSFKTVNSKIELLSDTIAHIHSITETINNIAKQTNLLSLNASIEAARAGEAGAGFVVVANEVKKLAEQTMKSAQSISALINEVTENAEIVTGTAADAIHKVDAQSTTINDTIEAFNNIVRQINAILPQINEVAGTLDHTIAMKNNIMTNMESMSSISENISASAEEVSASIQGQSATTIDLSKLSKMLSETSRELMEGVEKFKI